MRYLVKRMSKAERMRIRWREMDKHYVPRVDDATFARRLGVMRRKQPKSAR